MCCPEDYYSSEDGTHCQPVCDDGQYAWQYAGSDYCSDVPVCNSTEVLVERDGIRMCNRKDGFGARAAPMRQSGFQPRESSWGIGYGGDSWAETEMRFNGMSAFRPQSYPPPKCPDGYSFDGEFCSPPFAIDDDGGGLLRSGKKSGFQFGPYIPFTPPKRDYPTGNYGTCESTDGNCKKDGFRSGGRAAYGIEHYAAFVDDDNALADYESYDDCFDDGTRRMYLGSDPRGIERRNKKYTRTLFGSEHGMNGIGYMPRHTPQSGNDTCMARVLRPIGNTLQHRPWVFDPSTRRWLQQ
jgi:hypothetical protein